MIFSPSLKLHKSLADAFKVRREIGLWTEWNWARGQILADAAPEALEAQALALALALRGRYPRRFGSVTAATAAIATEIRRSLLALSYGKRQPGDLHPSRLDHLRSIFPGSAELPIFAEHMS